MNRTRMIHSRVDMESYLDQPLYAGFDAGVLERHGADVHLLHEANGGARCSLWWSQVPGLPGERLGVLGHFSAATREAALGLFEAALARLREQGCTRVVGPMDGNTWRSYRLVTGAESEPPFFMEPFNPPDWPDWFEAAGFTPLAGFVSALNDALTQRDPRVPKALQRMQAAGIQLRALDGARYEDELRAIYRLSVQAFSGNFLYTPIDEESFVAQYCPLGRVLRPELILLAERDGVLVGYLFGLPDFNQAARGHGIDTFIIKTVAVAPGRDTAGLGSVLAAQSQRIALELGYTRAIHALMHESNVSLNISTRYAHVMRRYTLYQARLAPA